MKLRSRRGAVAALAGLAGLIGLILGVSPAPGQLPSLGLNVHAPWEPQLSELFDASREAGYGWVRVDFVWAEIEPAPDEWSWAAHDAIVDAAEARGLQILAILAYTPQWATDGAGIVGVPRDVADWQDFCGHVAARYAGRVNFYELWNEPNQPGFWAGTRDQYIDGILIPGAASIRAHNPAARIGGPGLAHLVSGGRDWFDWLDATVRRAGGALDFVTHHLYDRDGPGDVTEKLTGSTPFANRPDLWDVTPPSVRELLKRAGWYPSRPVWLTETGWSTAEVGEADQASHVGGLLDTWLTGREGTSWLERVFLYEIQDPGGPGFGLRRGDGSPKPAWDAARDFIAAQGGAPGDGGELALLGGRFAVRARWRTPDGATGVGHAQALTDQSGTFWFFGPDNLELIVKALDGRGVNGSFWIYSGALSDVEYWVTVTDRATGRVREYYNPQGRLCGVPDSSAFPEGEGSGAAVTALARTAAGPGAAAATCAPDARTLCLGNGRFQARVDFHWPPGTTGQAKAVPATRDSGMFWFFGPENIELIVKVLDGRPINGRFWVMWGALSDVEYDLTVTDLATGSARTYHNAAGNYCGGSDTGAF